MSDLEAWLAERLETIRAALTLLVESRAVAGLPEDVVDSALESLAEIEAALRSAQEHAETLARNLSVNPRLGRFRGR